MTKKQLYTAPDCEQMFVRLERTILSYETTELPPIPDDKDDDEWDDVI